MIDLVLYASTRAAIRNFAISNHLLDANGKERIGVDFFWWHGNGKFASSATVHDANGNVVTPATYLPGFVMVLRISEANDNIGGSGEQWTRSRIAKYIRDNGTPGTMGALSYYELDNVRLFRASDVFAWLVAQGIASHEWYGGNRI